MATRRFAFVLGIGAAVGAVCTWGGCTTNPATGDRILTLLPKSQEIALGAQVAPQFTQEYGGAVPSSQLAQYVTDIGLKMAATTEADYPSYPWEFTLLNSDVVNAFALPGGKVFFSRGLAEQLTTEAQMAGVIGHEIGHVTAQHGNQRISQSTLLSGALEAAAVIVDAGTSGATRQIASQGIPALSMGGQLVLLKYGRDQELQADELGVRYMTNVGYDPRGQLEVMQVLAKLSKGSSQPAILSTHPDPEARIDQIRKMLDGEYKHTQGNPKFQAHADRYKREFLDPISKIAPPPASQQGMIDGLPVVAWCAVCAADAGDPSAARMLAAAAMMHAPAR